MPYEPGPLYASGYRVTAHGRYTFTVTNPQGRTYMVRPLSNACSCPATVPRCKHLKELATLILDCWIAIDDTPENEERVYDLMQEYDATRRLLKERIKTC